MRIISKSKIREYYDVNIQSKVPLTEWFFVMKIAYFKSFHELSAKFNSADFVNGYTVFDIGGNNYRLITSLHYNSQRCYIRKIWTHAEYSKVYNQTKLTRGEV